MNNFGVIEVASVRTTIAPGWAYVPDTSIHPSSQRQPGNRKRARNAQGPSIGDLTARQEARIRKEVEALERDWGRDNTIPVPVRSGGRAQGKSTANVRKILQSQKTFANHLDDFLALQQSEAAAASSAAAAAANNKRAAANKSGAAANKSGAAASGGDTPMTDAADADAALPPVLEPLAERIASDGINEGGGVTASSSSTSPPGDDDPLLASRLPDTPTGAELHGLLSHPPLTYLEARGTFDVAGRPPARVFCEVCGYWGRVRCMKCGTRVCALECLETHREECVTRYGL